MEIDDSIRRMVEARWNKARRDELMTIPPAGYDVDDLNQLVMTSDESISHALARIVSDDPRLGA